MGWAERRKRALKPKRDEVIRLTRRLRREFGPACADRDAAIIELLDALDDWKGRPRGETHPRAHAGKVSA